MLFESHHVRVEAEDQTATLWLDAAGSPQNRFNTPFLEALGDALRRVDEAPGLETLIVRSAKPAHFSAGYDLAELLAYQRASDFCAYAARGQDVLARLEQLGQNLRTVALIEGPCLGPGLELALACRHRVAVGNFAVTFGLPQVSLGLVPCWGGTVRLPRVVGLGHALRMLLDGQSLGALEAYRWGLVDAVLDFGRAHVEWQAFLERLRDGSPGRQSLWPWLRSAWERLPFVAGPVLGRARRALSLVPDECSAAREAFRALRAGMNAAPEGEARERAAFGRLGVTDTFRHLARQQRVAELPARVYPEPSNPLPPLPGRVAVVGGGRLGSRLTRWLALRGCEVVLRERDDAGMERANRRLEAAFHEAAAAGLVSSDVAERLNRGVRRTTGWNGFESAGWVIEAVEEDLGVKHEVFHALETQTRPRTVLTSATSTLRVEALQGERERPGRVAGVHFADFPEDNPLVEIVRAPGTDPDTVATLDGWLRTLGKTPIVVSDRPGRVLQRLRLAYLAEAVLLVAEGLPPEKIDRAARRFGMARGPLATVDAIGFDSLARLAGDLQLARGDRWGRILLLERMRSLGWDGKAGGEGFYRYRGGKARPNKLARVVMWQDLDEDAISHYVFDPAETLALGLERLVLRTVNEAAACLGEEPDADPAAIDLAAAWGLGWAPHQGGPLHFADRLGLAAVAERLVEFSEQFGKRFEPSLELQRRAEAGEPFHGGAGREEALRLPEPRRLAG